MEEVVGKAADVVRPVRFAVWADPRPAAAASSEGRLRTEGATGTQLHETQAPGEDAHALIGRTDRPGDAGSAAVHCKGRDDGQERMG